MWGWSYPGVEQQLPGSWNNTLPDNGFNGLAVQWSIIEWGEHSSKSIAENENYDLTLAHAMNEFPTVNILIGEITGNQELNNLDLTSFKVNSDILANSATVLQNYPGFEGAAIKVDFAGENFWNKYGFIWENTTQLYLLEGTFTNGQPFSKIAQITVDGFLSGDANLDGKLNIFDLIFLVDYIFRGGPEPIVPETADMDHSCDPLPNIKDLTKIVAYIFNNSRAPRPCGY